jgi:hypothetical protein
MKEAIKKAIEGGYNVKSYCENTSCNDSHALYDPLFWQALGKAEGWKGTEEEPRWAEEWHSFIDHLAEGKDIELYFTNLLSK